MAGLGKYFPENKSILERSQSKFITLWYVGEENNVQNRKGVSGKAEGMSDL